MKKFIFIAIITLGVNFSACQKEKEIFPNQSEMTTTPPPDQGDTIAGEPSSTGNPKAAFILNATSASQIPSMYFYSGSCYKNKYTHVKQYSGECSWTSYVLCAGAIVNGNFGSYVYTVNHPAITSVKNWCRSSYIERLRDYANQMDGPYFGNVYLSKEYKTSTGRFNTIKQMLNHLYVYQKPFIAIITNNGIGHYVVVWDIDWKCGGTGSTVYYTDPLDYPASSFYSQRQGMNMTTFLDKMGPLNNYVSKYCALFLK